MGRHRSPTGYSGAAIALHWAIALLIFVAFPLGLYMSDLPLGPQKLRLYSYHKWIGIAVLLLAIPRIAWRIRHRPPDPPPATRTWERQAAAAMQAALYLLIVAVPLCGWLMSSATGFQVVWLGVIPLPDLVPRNKALGEILTTAHAALAITMMALVAGHALAALRHHFVSRDDVLVQMAPWLRKRGARSSSPVE